VRGPLLVFLLPAPVLAPLARSRRVLGALSALLRPRVAFTLWAANLATWHVPYLYDLALAHQNLHDFEHACWMVFGTLLWTLLVDPGSHRRLSVGGRVALAAAMFAAGQILSDVLVFSFTPLYPWYHGAYGISALTDQQLSGIVMMVEQLATLATCVALLLLPRRRRRAVRLAVTAT
jgi:cytochrome c oxidase assembly factor CtaG